MAGQGFQNTPSIAGYYLSFVRFNSPVKGENSELDQREKCFSFSINLSPAVSTLVRSHQHVISLTRGCPIVCHAFDFDPYQETNSHLIFAEMEQSFSSLECYTL